MFYLAVNNFYFYFSVQVQTDQRKSTHQGGVGNYFGPHAPLTRPKKLVDEQVERTNKLVQQWQQQQQQQQTTTVD